MDFYNKRRRQAESYTPNASHLFLKELEQKYNTSIITQNVDHLHEKAGSTNIMHLHGKLSEAKSTKETGEIINVTEQDIILGDQCNLGYQLRPNIVWFGETVPLLSKASNICKTADIFVIIGTSLQVYPASGLIKDIPPNCPVFIIDPNVNEINIPSHYICIQDCATSGIKTLKKHLNIL